MQSKSKTFSQAFLKPGRYHLGGGVFRDFSAGDLDDYVRGTQELLRAGHAVPVLYEHAAPGSEEGAPVQLSGEAKSRRDQLADGVRHGAGWLKGISIGGDGAAVHELDLLDPEAIKSVEQGRIKFTSPEFRESWTDGNGREFKRIISHVALTHKPRSLDQSAIVEAARGEPAATAQFSLADWQQFADDDDDEGRAQAPDEQNKDIPGQPDADPQFQAVLEHLKNIGLDLTSDTTPESFVRDLLTALKTKAAVESQMKEDDADDDENDDSPESQTREEKPPVQFSLADAEGDNPAVPKLLGLVMRGRHDAIAAHVEAGRREGQFTPALAERLTTLAGSMQFSADADEQPRLTVGEVVAALRETLPKGAYTSWTTDQFSAAETSVELPPGELTVPPDNAEMTTAQAKAFVDAQSKFIPGLAQGK